jgi:hypothetical protein
LTELTAGKAAHLLLAQSTIDHMNAHIKRSQQAYKFLKLFRRRMLFAKTPEERKWNKLFWTIGIVKLNFAFIADYQMVLLIHNYKNGYIFILFYRINSYHISGSHHKSVFHFLVITLQCLYLGSWTSQGRRNTST